MQQFLQKYRMEFVIAALFCVAFAAFSSLGMITQAATTGGGAPARYAAVMAVLSAAVFLVARISYPKIYKFKILLSGYVLVAIIINFFIMNTPTPASYGGFNLNFYGKALEIVQPRGGNFAFRFLFTLLNLNLLIVILASAYVNYNAGKNSSWAAFGINILIYLLVLAVIPAGKKSPFVYGFLQTHVLVNCIITGLTVIFSLFTIEEEHNYGSIIVALSIMSLYCELFSQNIGQVKFLLPAMEIIIIWGMFAHWVNCLHHKAHYDPLLKIYNRQYMDNIIHGIADVRLGKKLSVMMCDIDHFKKVNDTYGHAAGDAVLFSIAQIIRDTALPEGVVCRYGGEEIIVFLRDKTGEEAKSKGEKIRKAVKAASVKYKSKNIKVTMSIGVASTKNGLEDFEKIIKKADDCVYKAKKTGRDKVVLD
jgi:diguanylate cyclase (GGDEF)-like protein